MLPLEAQHMATTATSKRRSAPRELVIAYRRPDELKLDPSNPRLHSKKQIQQIARSIEAFGFNVPVLTRQDGQVAAGHGRVEAAKLLKLDRIPAIQLEHLTEVQLRAFMIADNRL